MNQFISSVALVVRDYDEAIAYYTTRLGFDLIEDTDLGDGKRWVQVAPPGLGGTRLLLARATTPEQQARIGDQTGGRVFLFLASDDFWPDYHTLQERGVQFIEEPRHEAYGTAARGARAAGPDWQTKHDGNQLPKITVVERTDIMTATANSFAEAVGNRNDGVCPIRTDHVARIGSGRAMAVVDAAHFMGRAAVNNFLFDVNRTDYHQITIR